MNIDCDDKLLCVILIKSCKEIFSYYVHTYVKTYVCTYAQL